MIYFVTELSVATEIEGAPQAHEQEVQNELT
jgi:hypothetical protein